MTHPMNRPTTDPENLPVSERVDVNGEEIDLTPPESMREEARRGLEWRKEHDRGGTEVGVARARQLSEGGELSVDDVIEMAAWKARHMVDREAEGWSPGEDGYPSAGRIAAALWGLPAGDDWVDERRDMIEAARDDDKGQDEMKQDKTERKAWRGGTVKALGERQVRVIASTETADRVGDVVRMNGVNLHRYRQNPVILFNHDQDCPVARCIDIGIINGRLEAVAEFPPQGTSEKSDEVYRLIKAGVINAVSVGFIGTEVDALDSYETDMPGLEFRQSELLEFSFVSVPANPDALIIERAFNGRLSAEEQASLAKRNLELMQKQNADDMVANNNEKAILQEARDPVFDGTEEEDWSAVDKDMDAFIAGYFRHETDAERPDDEIESVDQMNAAMRRWIAARSLLGNEEAETFDDLVFFPVVNPATNRLNANALRAVLSGRGEAADIPEPARESAQSKARMLLDEYYGDDDEDEAEERAAVVPVEKFTRRLRLLKLKG